MIPYNNPEEQLDHEEYLDELDIFARHTMIGPLHILSIPKALRARRGYFRDDFLSTDIYAFMAQCAYANIPWAVCEYKILVYTRLALQEKQVLRKRITRKRTLSRIQEEKRELFNIFFDITGEDISTYTFPFKTMGCV